MSTNKKPRKAYRPRPVTANTMAVALHLAAKPQRADREDVLGILRASVKALREGSATDHDWSVAAGAIEVARAIERRGIVRGLHEHIATTDAALGAIYARALRKGGGHWRQAPTLYFDELDALTTFVGLHDYQMRQLSRAEMLAAIEEAQKHTRAKGHSVTLVHDLENERMAA